MPHCRDIDASFVVEYRVDHTIVADADTPEILFSGQLARTVWTRVRCKQFYLRKDTANDRRIENLKLMPGRASKGDPVFSHVTCLDGEDDL